MSSHRSMLLLEVVLGLALLASLGVGLLQLETAAIGQFRQARERGKLANLVEDLLWNWRASQSPVTLPATGRLNDRWHWRREVQSVRVVDGLPCTQVSLIVNGEDHRGAIRELYRVDWLMPKPSTREDQE